MFLGHMAVGFAAKRVAPSTSLGVLLAASEFVDLLFPVFLMAGWEQARIVASDNPFLRLDLDSIPYSHSLAASLFWGFLAAVGFWLARRRRRDAVVVGLVVLSHWVLDVISHQPDMPLYPGTSPKIGLGLWNSLIGTVVVEGLMFAAGVWLYATTTRARDRIGVYGFWGFVLLLVGLYAGSILGPPPPDIGPIAWIGLVLGLFYFWAAWFDRHREVVPAGLRK
jgi:membrane-bound metal-dependent hydrolase YbcI (DUF457 family)